MFAFLFVAVSALCSTQATGLSQTINDLHLHAKLGEGIPESVPLTGSLNVTDEQLLVLAQNYLVQELMPKSPFLVKAMYGPIENVVLPGVKLPRPVNLTNIRVSGLTGLQLNDFQWRTDSNRLVCNVTIPFLVVDVTFDNVQIELDENFGDQDFYTSIRLSVRLLDLDILASARYEIIGMSTNEHMFIDKAEVDINAREAVFELKVVHGLEEVRYVLSELLNDSLEDIMDAVLKVAVQEINKLLLKMDPEGNIILIGTFELSRSRSVRKYEARCPFQSVVTYGEERARSSMDTLLN